MRSRLGPRECLRIRPCRAGPACTVAPGFVRDHEKIRAREAIENLRLKPRKTCSPRLRSRARAPRACALLACFCTASSLGLQAGPRECLRWPCRSSRAGQGSATACTAAAQLRRGAGSERATARAAAPEVPGLKPGRASGPARPHTARGVCLRRPCRSSRAGRLGGSAAHGRPARRAARRAKPRILGGPSVPCPNPVPLCGSESRPPQILWAKFGSPQGEARILCVPQSVCVRILCGPESCAGHNLCGSESVRVVHALPRLRTQSRPRAAGRASQGAASATRRGHAGRGGGGAAAARAERPHGSTAEAATSSSTSTSITY